MSGTSIDLDFHRLTSLTDLEAKSNARFGWVTANWIEWNSKILSMDYEGFRNLHRIFPFLRQALACRGLSQASHEYKRCKNRHALFNQNWFWHCFSAVATAQT